MENEQPIMYHVLVSAMQNPCHQCEKPTNFFVMEFDKYLCEPCLFIKAAVQFLKDEHQKLQAAYDKHFNN